MKRRTSRLLYPLLTLCMMLALLLGAGLVADTSSSLTDLTYDVGVEGAYVSLWEAGDEYVLFLPSFADLSKMVFRFTGDPITLTVDGRSITVVSGKVFDLTELCVPDGDVYAMTLSRGDASLSMNIMVSANIGSMFINSANPVDKGRSYVEAVKGNKATGQMILLNVGGEMVYTGGLSQIKGRGNTTWESPKKPYQIKLYTETDLLETGDASEAAKTWILLANYYDNAFIRNSLTFDLAAELGLPYSPGSRPVDLYYDGEYRGTYLLCEKTEIGSARVDIYDLEADFEDTNPSVDDFDDLPTAKDYNAFGNEYQYVAGLVDPKDISGGYLLEMEFAERAVEEKQKSYFTTSHGYCIVSKSPEYLSREAMEYISCFYQEFEDAVWNDGINPTTGKSYTNYVDLDSLARCFVIEELSQDGDAYQCSTFFYKPAGEEKLYAGPVWDFDMAYGKYSVISSDAYLVSLRILISQKLLAIPSFYEAVEEICRNELHTLVTNVLLNTGVDAQFGRLRSLAGYQAEVAASQRMNSVLWPETSFQSYTDAVNELRDFIIRRDELLNGLNWADALNNPILASMSVDDWYYPYVVYVREYGLMDGVTDGWFNPNGTVTCGMMMTILARLDGVDTSGTPWYQAGVEWAVAAGVSDGTDPTEPITREQVAVMLWRYALYKGYDVSIGEKTNILSYDDAFVISEWAISAMQWAIGSGVMDSTTSSMLSPLDGITRAEVAVMLTRFCQLIEKYER